METSKMEFEKKRFYLDGVWQNIRHNENMRNRLFQIYVIISGSFFVVFKSNLQLKSISIDFSIVVSSFFIWLITISFLWSFERIKEMIERDTNIVASLNGNYEKGSPILKNIYTEYKDYKEKKNVTSLSWFSISGCISLSTSVISALIVGTAIIQHLTVILHLDITWYFFILLIIGLASINRILILCLNKIAKIKK